MAFLLGSFTNGLFSGFNESMQAANSLMSLRDRIKAYRAADAVTNATKEGAPMGGAIGAATKTGTSAANADTDINVDPATVHLGSTITPKYAATQPLQTPGPGQAVQPIPATGSPTGPGGALQPANNSMGGSGGHFYTPPTMTAPANMPTYDIPQMIRASRGENGRGPATPGRPSWITNQPVGATIPTFPTPSQSQITNQPVGATVFPGQAIPTQQPVPAPMAAAPSGISPNMANSTQGLGARLLGAMGTMNYGGSN